MRGSEKSEEEVDSEDQEGELEDISGLRRSKKVSWRMRDDFLYYYCVFFSECCMIRELAGWGVGRSDREYRLLPGGAVRKPEGGD